MRRTAGAHPEPLSRVRERPKGAEPEVINHRNQPSVKAGQLQVRYSSSESLFFD